MIWSQRAIKDDYQASGDWGLKLDQALQGIVLFI